MNIIKKILTGFAFAASACMSATAAPVNFNITNGNFVLGGGYGTGSGQLDALFTSTFSPQSFSLNAGQTKTFSFGTVNLREGCINTGNFLQDLLACGFEFDGNERDNLGVTARLTFTDPVAGIVNNVAMVGAFAGPVRPTLLDDLWIDFAPVVVNFGAGGSFSLDLNDMHFNTNETLSTNATIKLLHAPAEVPEPATLALLGAGLLGVGGLRRRKQGQ